MKIDKNKHQKIITQYLIDSIYSIIGDKAKYINIDKKTNLKILDSIEIVSLVNRIENSTKKSFDLETIQNIKTVDSLANFLLDNGINILELTDKNNTEILNKKDIQESDDRQDLGFILDKFEESKLVEKASYFSKYLQQQISANQLLIMRRVLSVQDRTVLVENTYTREIKELIMFGSNNYLGMANHPYIKKKICEAAKDYGSGMAGSSLLNGYSKLAASLEERLANFKQTESAILFSSGYNANIGTLSAILQGNNLPIADELIHASLIDGIKLAHKPIMKFSHNNVDEFAEVLSRFPAKQEIFTIVEGVYSMDGDLSPLDKIASLCKKHNSLLIVDDAHGFGVMGKTGRGAAEHYNVQHAVDISLGTFSKAIGAVGGFACASKDIINYLRFYARSYMFSCALPPTVIASINAALDIMEMEPWRLIKLRENINYLKNSLNKNGIPNENQTAIFAIKAPSNINIRRALMKFNDLGIFLNSVEYPAVPHNQERFRISLSSTHNFMDIDHLVDSLQQIINQKNGR